MCNIRSSSLTSHLFIRIFWETSVAVLWSFYCSLTFLYLSISLLINHHWSLCSHLWSSSFDSCFLDLNQKHLNILYLVSLQQISDVLLLMCFGECGITFHSILIISIYRYIKCLFPYLLCFLTCDLLVICLPSLFKVTALLRCCCLLLFVVCACWVLPYQWGLYFFPLSCTLFFYLWCRSQESNTGSYLHKHQARFKYIKIYRWLFILWIS